MSDDDMTQREKRLQRHKAESRKDRPKQVAKTYGIWLLVLLVVGGAGYALYQFAGNGPDCPGHWHATFEVYVPGPNGQPQRIDMASPRAPNGAAYYDLNSGGAGFGLEVHMHQSGPEAGDAAQQPAQWHFEKDTVCVGVKTALHAVEIDASATGLHIYGAHAQVHQDHDWTVNATNQLRYFTQTLQNGTWTWQEKTWDQVKSYQLPDGSSLLVAFGNYTPEQIKAMQAHVPAPLSRPGIPLK